MANSKERPGPWIDTMTRNNMGGAKTHRKCVRDEQTHYDGAGRRYDELYELPRPDHNGNIAYTKRNSGYARHHKTVEEAVVHLGWIPR